MQKLIVITLIAFFAVSACQKKPRSSKDVAAGEKMATETVSLEKVWETDTLLTTAESVLHDESRGVFYVSCIGAVPPWENDGDGFIAKVDEKGKILERKWVTGLSAPKGMGMFGNILYVNDNDRLVSIDVTTGEILDRMPIADAGSLNDIAVGKDGALYLTDSNSNTAYKVEGGEVTTLVSDTVIGRINGVFVDGNRFLLAGFNSGNLFTFNPEAAQLNPVSDGMQGADGIEKYGSGFFVSSWNGEIYHLDKDWKKNQVLTTRDEKINAADIEVVAEKQLLLVPTFFDNRVMAYRIQGN